MREIQDEPIVEILARIGKELEEAAASVDDLHAVVEAMTKGGDAAGILFEEAQRIDLLQQHLFALSAFISELSKGMPSSWRIDSRDALSRLNLSELKKRLARSCDGDGGRESGEFQIL